MQPGLGLSEHEVCVCVLYLWCVPVNSVSYCGLLLYVFFPMAVFVSCSIFLSLQIKCS